MLNDFPANPHSGSNPNEQDLLEARPTQRLGNQRILADGDTWQETLAVCETPGTGRSGATGNDGKLIVRSYYQNVRSGKRVWDEPPSGATNILPASDEMRKMAELQLAELHIVTGGTGDESNDVAPKKKSGFLGWGRKKKDKDQKHQQQPRKIRYKPGSSLLASRKGSSSQRGQLTETDDAADSLLQQAIALSLQPNPGAGAVSTSNYPVDDDDDELAMAKALSLSTASDQVETEDQLLTRVLEQSRLEDAIRRGANQASESSAEQNNDLLNLYSKGGTNTATAYRYSGEEDRKPAAIPGKMERSSLPPSSSGPTQSNANHQASSYAAHPARFDQKALNSDLPRTSVASSSHSPTRSPMSRFDPYDKHASSAPPAAAVAKAKPPPPSTSPSTLKKMNPNKEAPGNSSIASSTPGYFFGKRASSKKVQDQAGLV